MGIREREGRKEEAKGREAPAAFPDDPRGDTQLSSLPDYPPSPSLSPPFSPLNAALQEVLQQNDFNGDILPQLRLDPLYATQIKLPPHSSNSTRG